MVRIDGYGEGTCIWCSREKEGVEVTTDDRSFVGFLCFPDLKRMLRLKTPKPAEAARSMSLLTPKEASARMRCSLSMIYQLVEERRLSCVRIGAKGRRGKILLKLEDVDRFIRLCTQEAETGA